MYLHHNAKINIINHHRLSNNYLQSDDHVLNLS